MSHVITKDNKYVSFLNLGCFSLFIVKHWIIIRKHKLVIVCDNYRLNSGSQGCWCLLKAHLIVDEEKEKYSVDL